MFFMMDLMFPLFFLMFFAVFAVVIFRMFREWNHNNHSPRLTVDAKVVTKRTNVSRRENHRSTTYYVTFQVESGDRMELKMQGHEYGLLIEGDTGKLTFQGTRFLEFQRQ